MKIEDAKRLYAIGGESKDIALIYFSEDQLKERTLPKTYYEYTKYKSTKWVSMAAPEDLRVTVEALIKLHILKQEYNGDWVADYGNPKQEKFVIHLHDVLPCRFLAFKSLSLRDQFAANFADLIEAAKPLLG